MIGNLDRLICFVVFASDIKSTGTVGERVEPVGPEPVAGDGGCEANSGLVSEKEGRVTRSHQSVDVESSRGANVADQWNKSRFDSIFRTADGLARKRVNVFKIVLSVRQR